MGIRIPTRPRFGLSGRHPALALAAVSLASLGARAAWIGLPCHASCRTPSAHALIFDERYYVNAARVIAGIRPPALAGTAYRHAPLGSDPNAEHPQLAKLIMAGSIELLGDGPWGWRLGSLIFGTLAILGMFALVRWAGGGAWLSVGAAALMAADNLMLVAGRLGILEIYVVAAMVWSVALYLRGRPLLSGLAAGVGACMKLFGLDVLAILVMLELMRWWQPDAQRRREQPRLGLGGLTGALAVGAASFLGLLVILDQVVPPYDNSARRFVSGGPVSHLSHMISYGIHQIGSAGAGGIASRPWEWLVDYKPIAYLTIDPSHPGALRGDHPAVHFLGLISPPILLAGLIGTALALWSALAARPTAGAPGEIAAPDGTRGAVSADTSALGRLAAAWFVGTFGPFLVISLAFDRTSYLYYMTVVMPGMYVAAVWLAHRLRQAVWLVWAWAALVAVAAVVLYPFTPLP
jgi:hypothetical protein